MFSLTKHVTRQQTEYFRTALSSLVDTFSGIVRVHVDILGPEVAPLKSVDGTEVALLAVAQADGIQKLPGTVPVPDADLND